MAAIRRFAIFAALLLAVCPLVAAAQPRGLGRPQLFEPVGPSVPHAGRTPGVATAALPIRFNVEAMLGVHRGDEVALALPDGTTRSVVFELAQSHGHGVRSWVGHLVGRGNHDRVIVTTGPGGSFGTIESPEGTWQILPGGTHDWLVDLAQEAKHAPPIDLRRDARVVRRLEKSARLDLSKAQVEVAEPGVNVVAAPKAMPAGQAVVDIMFVVNKALADRLGANLATRLQFLVTRANTAYTDSEIAITLHMVNYTVVDWPETGDDNNALDAITPGPGLDAATFGNIETLRSQYGADVVSFLRDGASFGGSGLAWVPNPANADLMYSTIQGCVLGCEFIFIHEVAHNMGDMHDRATVEWQDGGTSIPTQGLQPYSYGYAFCKSGALACNPTIPAGCSTQPECSTDDPSNFSDIMAYFHGSTNRIYKFSNPAVTCLSTTAGNDGLPRPCGVDSASPQSADTAKSMNGNRLAMSAVKATVPTASTPGSLQFTSSAFSGSEDSGRVMFTVSRINGSAGTVSVSYGVASGSGISGIDFTPVTGTLVWGDNDSSDRSFSVPVYGDMAVEGAETFTAALSGLSGPAGVYLGYPATATATITEPWPPGNAFPAGWTTPSGAPWIAATGIDPIEPYPGSLRSGDLVFSGATPTPSATQMTAAFVAGPVAFGYAVDGYPGFGFLDFLVDGTVVFSDNGDTGWRSYSTTLTAGVHTLQWRYRTTLSFRCSSAIPQPPQGSSCSDHAWIDDLALPLAVAASSVALASSSNPSTLGQSVTFTANVSGSAGAPGGTVRFKDGANVIPGCAAVAVASGSAACTSATLTTALHAITAVYSGSPSYAPGTSAAVNQNVTTGPQLLSASPAVLDFGGQSVDTTAPALASTITNVSGAALTIATAAAPPGFTVSANDCATLAPGASCHVSVTFTPDAPANFGGALVLGYPGGGPTAVNLAGVGELSLVTHYYRSILRRAPDAGGKAFWSGEADRVAALGANVNETWYAMAMSFYFSPEYAAFARDDGAFVTDLYNTFFNRAPDGGGLAFWSSQLGSGLPREVLLASFMFSTEFANFTQAIFGNTAARAEVNMVMDYYRGLLSRLPDTGGFDFWVQQFRTAQCQGGTAVFAQVESISSLFATSAEYSARNRSNAQYVGDLYNAFLRRGGDLPGVQFWVSKLDGGALNREQVRQQFVASPEFNARVAAVVNQGCAS